MLKPVKVIHLAPGEPLLILTDPAPKPVPPGAALPHFLYGLF